MSILPNGARAIMGSRREPTDSLEFFPTPPWATRALIEILERRHGRALDGQRFRDPFCGEGHMSEVLRQRFGERAVEASDIFDYAYPGRREIRDWLDDAQWKDALPVHWVIGNPPFGPVIKCLEASFARAVNVAMFLPTRFLEGKTRYRRIFAVRPPSLIAQFVERCALVKGRWDPDADTATAYAWFIWDEAHVIAPAFSWIPDGTRERLTLSSDRRRFAAWQDAPGALI